MAGVTTHAAHVFKQLTSNAPARRSGRGKVSAETRDFEAFLADLFSVVRLDPRGAARQARAFVSKKKNAEAQAMQQPGGSTQPPPPLPQGEGPPQDSNAPNVHPADE